MLFIKDIYSYRKPVISLEVFPPKKDMPVDTIYKTLEDLKDLKPDFISVTYGAGGSNAANTVEIASIIKNKYEIEALAHLTCVGSDRTEIQEILNKLKSNNIDNVLALRGDLPEKGTIYKYAKDLVHLIKNTDNFSIGGAAYPEGHLECRDRKASIKHLKDKVDAGVDFFITQLFFDNDFYYELMSEAIGKNINIPISAGIMPVLNTKQIEKMVTMCGASIPSKLKRILSKYEYSPEALKEAGISYATEQIIDLLSWGASGIHIYTMNKAETTKEILKNISNIRDVLRTDAQ